MVEFFMIFALGALTAMFGGLLLLPALNTRAQRLQRRKLAALYPMSIAEITAERDHVRAEMAVAARRTELRAEATAHEKAQDLAEIGRRDIKIHTLGETLSARETTIAGLEGDLAATRTTLADTQAVRDGLSADLSATRQKLAQVQDEYTALSGRFDRTDADLSSTRQTLLMTESTLTATQGQLAERNEAHASLAAAHQALGALADERQLAIAALETRLEILSGEKADLQRRVADASERIAALETQLHQAQIAASDANAFVAENAGKLDEARNALNRLETRQLAQQRAMDAAKQQARSERNAAQASALALVKAEAEIRRLEAKLVEQRAQTASQTSPAGTMQAISDTRVVRIDRERTKPPAKTKPVKTAAE